MTVQIDEMDEVIEDFKDFLAADRVVILTDEELKKRTIKQNNALHKWCRMVAAELCRQKIDMKDFISQPIYADEDIVKKYLWGKVMFDAFGKEHTSDLERSEVSAIYEGLNKIFAQGVRGAEPFHIPWPSEDSRNG